MFKVEFKEIIEKFLEPNEELLWQARGLKRMKKYCYNITNKRLFTIRKWDGVSDFPIPDFMIVQYFVSDMDFFFFVSRKKNSPKICDLIFKTNPISWENNRMWFLLVTFNQELPSSHPFYVQFILDNGWDFKNYVPTVHLLRMKNVPDREKIRSILINRLKIPEESSIPDYYELLKRLKREGDKVFEGNFHDAY
ncbi:MAG: hypothetical protein ACFE9T_13530 [Promethearchaeota archaeon]